MRNLRKNKFVVLGICVIVVSIAYFVVQKIIGNSFETNSDIITVSDEIIVSEETEAIKGETEISNGVKGEILEDEINFVKEESDEISEKEEVKEENKIYVYVTGEIINPGVVILNEGSRIVDAINAAGGTTDKADISRINLVYVLEDGIKVNIPNKNDLKEDTNFEYITSSSGDGGRDVLDRDRTSSQICSSESGSFSSNFIVNINTATQTELETLPGIGPSLALKIINYRKENGKFSCIEDIKNVSGIGEAKFESMKKYISI